MRRTTGGTGDAKVPLSARDCELVIFDLDGVLTQTAAVHAAAWKEVFDAFLHRRLGKSFRPFDLDVDYLTFVDGKPRLAGVRDFLESRDFRVPEGAPEDDAGEDTLWGIGNLKNRLFNTILERDGVHTDASGLVLLDELQACGIRRAVVSASRNARRVLDAAGLSSKLDTVVDGNDADDEGLAGKPAPDTFIAAAHRLDVPPSRAAVIEDAEAGVAAGRAGDFSLVIGVDRGSHAEALRAHGAHYVVRELNCLRPEPLPSAQDRFDEVMAGLAGRVPALFLDYDGTLTPIVSRPEDAVLSDSMRKTLALLASRCTVALVTGRDLEVIRGLVGMDNISYAADHGLELKCAGQSPVHPEALAGFETLIEDVARDLSRELGGVEGVIVEPKRYSVAVHYRLVADDEVAAVKSRVHQALARETKLRLLAGKKVVELRPDLEWDKGSAVHWVMKQLGVEPAQAIYMGDDVTDEAAFRLLRNAAAAVAVQETPRPTAAGYRLADVEQVHEFLDRLAISIPEQES